jgi:GNAT superfamily N-acetyltransferase
MPAIVVRPARPEDAEAVASVHVLTWQKVYRGHMPDDLLDNLSVAEWAEKRREWIVRPMRPGQYVFVAELEGEVVAFAAFGPTRDHEDDAGCPSAGEIYAIYAHPDRWGAGAGRALLEVALETLRKDGHGEVSLWVLDANERARRFYERAGFVLDGGEKTELFGGRPLRELRYRRKGGPGDGSEEAG